MSWYDFDDRDIPPLLPAGFCGMEDLEKDWEYEKREREQISSSSNLSYASTPDLLRELAKRLEKEQSQDDY